MKSVMPPRIAQAISALLPDKFKTVLGIILFTSSLLAVATEAGTQKRAGRKPPSGPVSIYDDARRQANAFWGARVTRCGEDHYSRLPNGNIIQYRGVSVRVTSSPLSEADTLNGYQFRGTVAFDYRLSREYFAQEKRWNQWSTSGSGSMFYKNAITKHKGKWNIEEAGNYTTSSRKKPIACSELADPAASTGQYFERRQQQVLDAEMAQFFRNRTSRGFISSTLTDEMWRYLGGVAKINWIYRASIFSKDQYLFARGESRETTYKNLPDEVIKFINEGYDPSSLEFAPNGGWVIFKTESARNYFNRIRVAAWNNIDEGLAKTLQHCVDEHLYIDILRFAPDGKAIIVFRDHKTTALPWNYKTFLPETHPLRVFLNGLKDTDSVNDVAFFPNGGYIAIYNGNGYAADSAPDDVLKAVADLHSHPSRCPINVSVGFDGTWLAYYSCFRGGP